MGDNSTGRGKRRRMLDRYGSRGGGRPHAQQRIRQQQDGGGYGAEACGQDWEASRMNPARRDGRYRHPEVQDLTLQAPLAWPSRKPSELLRSSS